MFNHIPKKKTGSGAETTRFSHSAARKYGGHLRFFVIKYVAQIRLKHGKHSRIGLFIYYDEMKANYTNALMRVGGYFWDFSTCVRLVPSIWRGGDSPKKTIVAIKFLQQALFLEVFLSEL